MLRSNWLPYIAAIGIVLAGAAHAQSVGRDINARTTNGQAKPKTDAPQIIPLNVQSDIQRISRTLETANNHPYAEEERQRAKDSLKAQQDTVFWARFMFLVALLETCITAAGVFLVWKTLAASRDTAGHAKRAADAARDTVNSMEVTAKRQLRAYLNILEGGAGGGRADIVMKNFGQTPANMVSFWADAVICDGNTVPPFKRPEGATASPEISVAPTGTFRIMPTIRDKRTPASISVVGQRPVIFAFGEVAYVDAFGSSQSIEFFLAAAETGGACRHYGPHNRAT